MRTETAYICEVCGGRYSESANAEQCERRVVPKPLPVGLLEMGEPGDFYDHTLAFAVARSWVEGHSLHSVSWACRDNGNGDSLGSETCGSPFTRNPSEFNPEWLKRPPMIRLVNWLRLNGHEPLVYVGGKIVPLEEVSKCEGSLHGHRA